MRYRSRADIVANILEVANGGVTKTKMMYHAYLSYDQLKEYLAVLLENGLLEHTKEEGKYRTTPKGMNFLKAYDQLAEVAVMT